MLVLVVNTRTDRRSDPVHRVVIFTFAGVQSLDVAGPAEVFAGANQLLEQLGAPERYAVSIVSIAGGVIETESAITLSTEPVDHVEHVDTLLLPGGFAMWRHQDDPETVECVRDLAGRANRLVTVCSGAFLAAAVGALDGHTVTTHWARSAELGERYPAVIVDDDPIFTRSRGDGTGAGHRDVWTSAGVTAGIDLTLAIVEHDHSTELAQTAARWLVMFLRRPGGQSQFATPTWVRQAPPGPIQEAQQLVVLDPAADHRVARLAARVSMSERHFLRRFSAEVGVSPSRYVARIRTEAARQALETTDDTVDVIARRCGFGTAETLRRTLIRHIGVSPDAYRRRFTRQHAPIQPIPRAQPNPLAHPDQHIQKAVST